MRPYSQIRSLLEGRNKSEFSPSMKRLLFIVFLLLMLTDRAITLFHFGFVYTDIDQLVMWNGAYDYARGIFHEPFFYAQPFNYMMEAFLAVPLLWMRVPVYIALPIITSILSLLPYIALAIFFNKRNQSFWALLCLSLPLLLPLPYNFLTTLSRGFVQAHLFVPLLFIPLFDPQNKKNIALFYLASSLCFIANQSSLLIVLPVALFVFTYHYKSFSFYLKSLWVLPVFIADHFARHFYTLHPERVIHQMAGMKIDTHTFMESLRTARHFENLFPFFSGWGIVYPFLFLILAIIALRRSMKKEFLFILTILILLILTFAIPKVQEFVPNTGIFFTPSRLFLFLPLLLILTVYFLFAKFIRNRIPVYLLLLLSLTMLITKNIHISEKAQKTFSQTVFPVAKNTDIVARANDLKHLAQKYKLDLIVHTTFSDWSYVFDSYAYNPLNENCCQRKEKTISVNIDDDRRTWLFGEATHCRQILLNGIKADTSKLKGLDYEILNPNQIVIKNNAMEVRDLFIKLDLKFGNTH